MHICFTGSAKVEGLHFERKHLIALAKEKGHHVDAHLDGGTNLVVQGEPKPGHPPTQKAQMAEKLGIEVVTPQKFLTLMGYL